MKISSISATTNFGYNPRVPMPKKYHSTSNFHPYKDILAEPFEPSFIEKLTKFIKKVFK